MDVHVSPPPTREIEPPLIANLFAGQRSVIVALYRSVKQFLSKNLSHTMTNNLLTSLVKGFKIRLIRHLIGIVPVNHCDRIVGCMNDEFVLVPYLFRPLALARFIL